MKVASEVYKGIEYVQISSLPLNQRNEILKSISSRRIIKILKNDTVLSDCVQYIHYEYWYENIFKAAQVKIKEEAKETVPLASLVLTSPR